MAIKTSLGTTEAKLVIKGIFEASYNANGTLTTSIMKKSGPVTLKINDQGVATLSGAAGVHRFSVSDELKSYGIELKYIKIYMSSKAGSDDLRYNAAIKLSNDKFVSIEGTLNIFALSRSCSGWLCDAARTIHGRTQNLNQVITRKSQGMP